MGSRSRESSFDRDISNVAPAGSAAGSMAGSVAGSDDERVRKGSDASATGGGGSAGAGSAGAGGTGGGSGGDANPRASKRRRSSVGSLGGSFDMRFLDDKSS